MNYFSLGVSTSSKMILAAGHFINNNGATIRYYYEDGMINY